MADDTRYTELLAAYYEACADAASGRASWQPIETAPRDGREVILRKGNRVGAACWCKWPATHDMDGAVDHESGEGWSVGLDGDLWENPTHWQSMPAAGVIACSFPDCNCPPDAEGDVHCHPAPQSPAIPALDAMFAQSIKDRDAVEAAARAIYEQWKAAPGWVPWVDGGNSHKQDEARRLASAAGLSPQSPPMEEKESLERAIAERRGGKV